MKWTAEKISFLTTFQSRQSLPSSFNNKPPKTSSTRSLQKTSHTMKAPKHIRNFALATSIAALLAAQTSNAATLYWDNSGGTANSWASLANWSTVIAGGTSPAALPGTEDVATFSATPIQGTNQAITLGADRSVLGLEFLSGVTATTSFTGNRLTIGTSGIRNAGSGAVTFSSTITLAGSQNITNNGTGQITFSSAISGSGSPTITNNGTGTGIVRFNGGVASSVTKVIQNSSTSKLQINGDSNKQFNSDVEVTLGTVEVLNQNLIRTNSVVVNGGTFTTANNIFTTTGNVSISSGTIILGSATYSADSLAISGGTIQLTGASTTSNFTVNSLTLSGDAIFTSGTPRLSGTSVAISGGNLTGTGILSIGSGGLSTTNTASASLTKVHLNGTQSWANNGTAELAILGAVTASGTTPTLTNNGTGTGSVRFASALPNTVSSVVQNSATSSLVLGGSTTSAYTGGTFVNAGTLRLGASNMLANSGAVTVAGGTFDIQTFSDTVGTVTLTSGSITGSTGGVLTGASYNVQSGSASAKLGGTNVTLTKTTSGTVTLSATNTYTGATTVSAGTLVVDGSISTSSLTTVASGGTLGGTGTVGKTVISAGGTLAVGTSPGTMTFTDTLGLNGTTVMEIDGTAGAGVNPNGHDFINLTGAGAAGVLTYGGTLTLDIGVVFGNGNYSWNLFDFVSETGGFTGISLDDKYSGSLTDAGGGVWGRTDGGNTWLFTESTGVLGLTVVPEPRAALLGSLGMLMLLRRRR